ncbi:hypothetical protein OR1_02410 [Geobacter sp. OR-1]|uniref:YkgJ family cysteine cluster protein n=1 Tax=Geobacter sp. OR-1 TaxID=1266765 RepID=UPI0005439B8F|nr:YkgJ family cysteine cluster protein [Geobacter sp. OR-1]GAM10122.1 hypothetical protein OR1_02410 [Geobacter sp. OR-1]
MLNSIREEVRRLRAHSDSTTAAWINGYTLLGGRVFCSDNCSNCCSLVVNCTWPESLYIAEKVQYNCTGKLQPHLEKLQEIIIAATDYKSFLKMHRQQAGPCPFLSEGSCSIYPDRPFSCRALLSSKDSFWCGADFGEMTSAEKQAFIASLDAEVVAFPTHYVAATGEIGQGLEARIADMMVQHLGFSIYGNLALMVLLNKEHDFAAHVLHGYDAVIDFLDRRGLNHPYLVSLTNPTT